MGISVHWHNCGCVKVQQRLVWWSTAIERFSLFRETERISNENYFEVSSSWALQSQFGGPRRLLSSWVSLSSLPWACSAPTLWAVSMAVMSRWAYLMEPSSGREISGKGGEKRKRLCFYFVFFNLRLSHPGNACSRPSVPEIVQLLWPCINWTIHHFLWHFPENFNA